MANHGLHGGLESGELHKRRWVTGSIEAGRAARAGPIYAEHPPIAAPALRSAGSLAIGSGGSAFAADGVSRDYTDHPGWCGHLMGFTRITLFALARSGCGGKRTG